MVLDGWRLLRPGSGQAVLLAIDFTLAKVRAQANFADLARLLPDGPAVWGTEEACWPAASGNPATQLQHWLRGGRDFDGTVRGVLGFCAGATLAGALAASIAEGDGRTPPVVLLDPVTPTAQTMIDQCGAAVSRMAAAAGEQTPPAPPATDDLDRLATLLTEWYAEVAEPVCAAQRVPPQIVEQLRQRVETNLRYLAMCATVGLGRASAALLVLSRDHAVPPQLRGTPEVRLDVDQNEVLADSGAARAVAGAFAATLPVDHA